jgi:hypothetical protein
MSAKYKRLQKKKRRLINAEEFNDRRRFHPLQRMQYQELVKQIPIV